MGKGDDCAMTVRTRRTDGFRQAEAYAERGTVPHRSSLRKTDLDTKEDYRGIYVQINPDSDAPDPEALTPKPDDPVK